MTVAVPRWSMQPLATAPRVRWANGGGWAQELLTWPPGVDSGPPVQPGDWRLRVSVAQVEAPGPFSRLPGVQRWLVPLSGGTVTLAWPPAGDPVAHGPGSRPRAFDGAEAPSVVAAVDPPGRLLNFMVRAEVGEGRLEPARPGEPVPAAPWRAVLGEVALGLHTPGGRVTVPALTLAWQAAGAAPEPGTLTDADGPAWWLSWWPRGA